MAPTPQEARAAFMRTFRETAPHQHRYEVWRDFVILAACALHNGLGVEETREAEYLATIGRYDTADQHRFPELLSQLVAALDAEPVDVLGPLYMELEIGSKDRGQFFSPSALSELMAEMTFSGALEILKAKPFVTVHEPACGAGGMVLAAAKTLIRNGHNPAFHMFASCVDVDRVAALMCYIQLSLWNMPAEVIVGNTLSLEMREIWYTPAYRMFNWRHKLAQQQVEQRDESGSPVPLERPREADGHFAPPEQLSFF